MLAGTIVLLSLLATSPAFAQTNDVCDNPFRELPLDGRTACVKPGACPGNAPARAEEFGQGNDRVCAFFIGEDRVFDRDFFDRDVVDVVPVISQDIEQEAESGDIDQSFDVSQTGDNSNQTAGIQGVANTGNAQNVIDVVDAGDFGDFDGDRVFVDNDGICEDDNDEDCFLFGDDVFFGDDGVFVLGDDNGECDENGDDEDCIVIVDDFFGDFDGDFDGDFEIEDSGASITMSPTNTTNSSQQVNQAAAASGDDCVPMWDPWWQTWVCLPT